MAGPDVNLTFTNITGVSGVTTNNYAAGSAFGWITLQGPVGTTNRMSPSSYYYLAGISNEASVVGASAWSMVTVFTNATAAIVNNGGTMLMATFTTNHSALSIEGTGVVSNKDNATIFTGTGSITKNGVNTFLLFGTNNFTGGFTNNQGITRLMGANVGMSGGVVLNNGLLDIRSSGALGTGAFTINGGTNDVSSGNGITNANNNLVYLNNSYVFTGGKTLALGTGTVTLGTNLTIKVIASTLNFGGAITGLNNGVSLNALDITKEGSGALLLGSTAPITLRGSQTNTVTLGTMILAAPIGDGGNNYDLTVMGAGNLMLLGNNTYGGATRVSGGGGIYFNNNNALGTGSLAYASAESFLQLGNGVAISNKTVSIRGGGSTFGVLQATNNGTATWAGGVVIDDTTAGYPRVGAQTGGTLTISGPISNGTGTNLYIGPHATGGKVILSGTNNTYSGLTSIIRGTLQLGATDALPTNTILDVRYNSTSTDVIVFDMNGFNQTVAVFKDSQAGYNVMTTNTQAGLSTLTLNQNADSTYRYTIGGNIALVKNGTGTLTLTGTNSYSGGTTINAGNIIFGSTNAITGSSYYVGSGAGVGVTYAMNQDFLARINPASAGVAVMGASTASNLDFNAAGLASISLGAFGLVTNSGTITPNGSTYRLGGGGGTNTLINVDQLTGGNNLVAFGGGSGGGLVLSVSNSFTGGTLINAGTVQIKDINALGTGAVTNNGTLQFKNASTITSTLPSISGAGVVDYNGGIVSMLVSNSYSGGTLISSGSARILAGDDSAFGTGPITLSGSTSAISSTGSEARVLANNLVISNRITFGNSTDNGPLTLHGAVDLGGGVRQVTISSPVTINGIISNGGWTNTGSSILTLTATNTYAGGTTLAGGTLSVGSYSNLPAAGGLLFKGGTLQITGTEITDLGVYSPNWSSFNGGLDVATSGNMLTVNNDITLSSTLTKAGAGALTLFQATTGSFIVNGGTLILTGATDNAGTFATVNTNATLVLAKDSSSAVHALNSGARINQGGTMQLAGTGGDQMPNSGPGGVMTNNGVFDLNGNSEIIAAMAGSGVTTNSSATPATLTINVGGTYTYSGTLLGAVSVQTISNGTWTLSGNNNISGGVTNAAGTGGMTFSGNNTLGSVVNNNSGTTLLSGTNTLGSATVNTGTLTLSGPNDLGSATANGGTLTLSGPNNLGSVTANGGTLTLSGSNAISSGVTLNGGTLNLNHAYALGAGVLTLTGGTLDNSSAGTLTNVAAPVQMNGIFTFKGTQSLSMGTNAVTLLGNSTVTNTALYLAINGEIGDGGNNYSLTKAGGGTLVLRGSNTWGGGMVLAAGTLDLQNSAALGTGTLTINGGALDNTGTGPLTLNSTPMAWNGNFAFTGTSNLNLGTGAVTLGNNIILTNKNRTLTIGGSIGDGGLGYGLTIAGGAGAVVLANTNTYTGLTVVNTANTLVLRSTNGPAVGSLQIGSGGANAYVRLEADQQLAATNVPIFNGAGGGNLGRLIMLGHTQTFGGLDDPSSKGMLENNDQPGGYHDFIAETNSGPAVVIVSNSANYVYAGYIRNYFGGYNGPSNTLSLVKDGAGTQALVGGNITYTGPTLVQNGTLMLSNTSGFASSVLITGGQLALATTAAINAKPITNNAVNGLAFLNTNAFTIGGLSGSSGGSVVLTNDAGAVTLITTGSGSFAGALEGTGSLTVNSGSQQTLSGANTFGGGVKLNGGRLNLNSAGALGTGALLFGPVASTLDNTSGAALTNANNNPIVLSNALYFAGSSSLHLGSGPVTIADGGHGIYVTNNTLTIGGVISDGATSAFLTKGAAGVLALTGTNTYTGYTAINGGTLRADLGIGLPITGNVDMNGGLLETGAAFTNALGTGDGQVRLRGSTAGFSAYGAPVTVNLGNAGSNLVVGDANFNPTTLVLNGATATDTLTLQNGIDLSSNSFTLAVNAQTAIISGNFTNSNATANNTLTKNGAGTLVLTGNNFFRSNVTANAGTLVLDGNVQSLLGQLTVGGVPSTSASFVISNSAQVVSGSTITIGGATGANSNSVLVSGSGTTWNLGGGGVNLASGVGTANWLRVENNAIVSNAAQVRVGAPANAFGNGLLITNGAQMSVASFILGRASTAHSNSIYVGGSSATLNNAGRLDIGGYANDGTVNIGQIGNSVTIGEGGVATNNNNVNIGAGTNAVGNFLQVLNGGQFVSKTANYIGYSAGGNSNWANVSGAGSLWDMSGQALTIGNTASATGNYLTVASGGVLTNGRITLGGTDSSVRFNGGRLVAGANGNLISGSGSVLVQSGGAVLDSAGFSVTNLMALTEDPASLGGGLTKLGTGTLALSGANTYSGSTAISNGTLKVASGASLSSATTLYVDNLGLIDFDGNSQTIAGLTGGGVVTNGGGNLTLNLVSITNTFGGALKGASDLTLTGGGKLIMAGTNSFSGGTLVSNATLAVNGLHNGGVITVISNGVVGGTGPISTLYVDRGGLYAPGNSLATQIVASLTLTNAGVLELELGNNANDQVIVTNSLVMADGAQLKLNLAAYSFANGSKITIVEWTGATGFTPTDPAQWFTLDDVGGVSNGVVWAQGTTIAVKGGTGTGNLLTINYDDFANGVPGTKGITLTAVPEPGTASLLGLVGVAWLVRRLRRRRAQG